MKYILVVGDGMADMPIDALGGKTPLEFLAPENMAQVGGGALYRFRSCPEGLPPGSDVAFLSLFGNDAKQCYTGRSPLEAAGLNARLDPGDVCFRVNLVSVQNGKMASHNGHNVVGEEARGRMEALLHDEIFAGLAQGMRFAVTDTFRHVAVLPGAGEARYSLTAPHDIAGEAIAPYLPADALLRALTERSMQVLSDYSTANSAWFWGAGTAARLLNFAETFGKKGFVATAVPLVKGIARLMGMDAPDLPFATGLLDTDYAGKARAVLEALDAGYDFAVLHVEAPDEASHEGSLEDKLEAIRRIDRLALAPLLRRAGDFRLMLMPDHYTLLSTRTHDGTPVPVAVYDSRVASQPRPFTEQACAGALVMEKSDALMRALFGGA